VDNARGLLRDSCIDDLLCFLFVGRKTGTRLMQFGEEFARSGSDITSYGDGPQFHGMIKKPEAKVPRVRGVILDCF
jgi:hypothetical protein